MFKILFCTLLTMVKLDPRLERRLDNYAILYCFYMNPREINQKVCEFVRRIKKLSRRRKYVSLMYYRRQKISCKAVKRGLDGFAKSYVGMDLGEKNSHDEQALSFITTVFPEDRDNVFYLIDYYNQQKYMMKQNI